MSEPRFDQFVLSNRDPPELGEWQATIARRDLLLPVSLLDISIGRSTACRAELGGMPASFACERRSVDEVVTEPHLDMAGRWRVAYAFGGFGDMLSSLAAGLAAMSYAAATGGVFYVPGGGVLEDSGPLRQHIDQLLAVHCDRFDLYRERYPDDRGDLEGDDFVIVSEVL